MPGLCFLCPTRQMRIFSMWLCNMFVDSKLALPLVGGKTWLSHMDTKVLPKTG